MIKELCRMIKEISRVRKRNRYEGKDQRREAKDQRRAPNAPRFFRSQWAQHPSNLLGRRDVIRFAGARLPTSRFARRLAPREWQPVPRPRFNLGLGIMSSTPRRLSPFNRKSTNEIKRW